MTTLFFILIVLCALVLGFIILVQNPKGGGLSGNIAGFSNQFMGVKQTNDVLEKGTWIFSSIIAVLCLFSSFFMSGSTIQKIVFLTRSIPIKAYCPCHKRPHNRHLYPAKSIITIYKTYQPCPNGQGFFIATFTLLILTWCYNSRVFVLITSVILYLFCK